MSEETASQKSDKKELSPVIIAAIIGLVGTLITTLANSPIFLELFTGSEDPTPTATLTVDAPKNATATLLPATSTSLPTETATLVLMDTPTPTTVESLPLLECLDQWEIVSTDPLPPITPEPFGNCSNAFVDELGIAASEDGLSFVLAAFKETGVYGISTETQRNATIELSIVNAGIISSEFWVGFYEEGDPETDALIYALAPDSGDVKIYSGSTVSPTRSYPWANLAENIDWLLGTPQEYTILIELEGKKVNMTMNGIKFATEIAPSTERLFLGYRTKPDTVSSYLDVKVSGAME